MDPQKTEQLRQALEDEREADQAHAISSHLTVVGLKRAGSEDPTGTLHPSSTTRLHRPTNAAPFTIAPPVATKKPLTHTFRPDRNPNFFPHRGRLFLAGKATEEAGHMAKEMNQYNVAIQHYIQASKYLSAQGSSEVACKLIEKGAKMMEPEHKSRAIELYMLASETVDEDEKPRIAAECWKRCAGALLRLEQLQKAIGIMDKVIDKDVSPNERNKACLANVILLLASGDDVEAGKRLGGYFENVDFVKSTEGKLADDLVTAYQDFDQEKVDKIVRDTTIHFLEQQVVRIALSLRVPGTKPVGVVEEEEEGDLC
jgi:tetratricopeptide (TPR) repeat protein